MLRLSRWRRHQLSASRSCCVQGERGDSALRALFHECRCRLLWLAGVVSDGGESEALTMAVTWLPSVEAELAGGFDGDRGD